MVQILFTIYDGSYAKDSDVGCPSYGPAITTSYEENGQIWVSNGEYTSRVNYCPYTGKKALIPIPLNDDDFDPPQAAQETVMPKYRIYIPVIADDVYEVEAESKEEARKYYYEHGLDYEHFVHTTNTEEMDMDYYDYPKIHIEEVD